MQFTPIMMHLMRAGNISHIVLSGVKYIRAYLSGKHNITGLHIFESESEETISMNEGIFLQ